MKDFIIKMDNLLMFTESMNEEMECRGDEDCDHCAVSQVLSESRLALISELASINPMPDTYLGRIMKRLSKAQEQYEKSLT